MSSRRGWRRRTRWSAWGRYGANTHRAVSSRGQWTETARSLSFRLGGRIPRRDRPRTPIPALPQGPDPFPAARVRARGRHRLPHLFHLCARAGCPLGHVPVARPRPQGAQRDGGLVAPPRRVRKALSQVVGVVGATGGREISQRMVSQRAFFGVSALLFVASAAGTIVWCASMSAMGEMPMPGGWTMSMAWMRMPGQTWPGAAASFFGMWVVMMVAMMLPSLVPMLWRYP